MVPNMSELAYYLKQFFFRDGSWNVSDDNSSVDRVFSAALIRV